MKQNLAAVWGMAAEISREVEKWLLDHDKIEVWLKLKPEDQARLLRLRVWSLRFGVPVSEIMDIVVPPLRAAMDLKRYRKRYGIGFPVSILCGRTAEKILTTIIGRRYPNGEQHAALREFLREQQLDAERLEELDGLTPKQNPVQSLLSAESLTDYVESYAREVMSVRARNRTEGSAKWRRRKRYRGNPW